MPEMKNQFTGGKMNKDLDERLVPKGEYRDAMNIQVSTSEGSEVGTVQNILGNKEVAVNLNIGNTSGFCVGSIADEKNDKVYFFIVDSTGNQAFPIKHMIVEHDVTSGNSTPVFVSFDQSVLGFNSTNLITGINIIDGMLFWTDGVNEPRKINIERCKAGTLNSTTETKLVNSYQGITINDGIKLKEKHITVIKKSPLTCPSLEMVGEREGNSYGVFEFNFTSTSVGDEFQVLITPYIGGFVNYQIGDVILVEELTSPPSFPIETPTIRLRVKTINVNTGEATLSVLSLPENVNANAVQYASDLDKSYEKIYKLKFPRFAIRYKYEDGEYSSFGPFSEIAFLPGPWDEGVDKVAYLPNTGYNKGMENRLREVTLKNIIPYHIPLDVKQVDILYKDDSSTNIYLVDEIKYQDLYWINNEYLISSENIKSIVPSNQILRPWDNVPRNALAQEITGNRIVYGNYLQNYDLGNLRAKFDVSLKSRRFPELTTIKSIKSLREYQLGVVYADKYNRQTPVLTDPSGAIRVSKADASNTNQLEITPRQAPPAWATHQKFYIKETSSEYYNLSLDRYFEAEDGNIWLSFASNDRNKIDLETTLYLKKKYNSSDPELTFEKYKVIDVKAEAPTYIKKRRSTIGIAYNGQPNAVFNGRIFNQSNTTPGGMPVSGEQEIQVTANALENTLLDNFHVRHSGFTSNIDADGMVTVTGGSALNNDPLFLKVKHVEQNKNVIQETNWYEIDNVVKNINGTTYTIRLKTPLKQADAGFTNNNQGLSANYSSALIGSTGSGRQLALEIAQDVTQNRSVFNGRFFVKILRTESVQSAIVGPSQYQNVQVLATARCGYLENFTKEDPYIGSPSGYQVTQSANSTPIATAADNQLAIQAFNAQGPQWNGVGHSANYYGGNNAPLEHPVPNDAYWSHAVWHKINQHLAIRESRWVIDAAHACGEEPLCNFYGPQFWEQETFAYNFDTSNPTAAAYGGYHALSSNSFTLDQNQNTGTWGGAANIPALGHGPANVFTPYDHNLDWEFYSTGKGIENNVIDISYIGTGEKPNAQNVFNSINPPAFNTTIWGDYLAASSWEDYFTISNNVVGTSSIAQEAKFFADKLVEENLIRFKNDPNGILYKITNVQTFNKYCYAESRASFEYPGALPIYETRFNQPSTSDPNDYRVGAAARFFNDAHFNRRVTYRLTLECIDSPGSPIGTDGQGNPGYNPIGPQTYDTTTGTYSGGSTNINSSSPVDCPIEVLTINYLSDEDVPFPENPAIFETEPKNEDGLNIYHEASETIPTRITEDNLHEFIPIGSFINSNLSSNPIARVNSFTWGSISNVRLIFDKPIQYFSNTWNLPITITRPDGTYTTALLLQQNGFTSLQLDLTNASTSPVGLGWHNCYSFGNGVESNRIRDTFNSTFIDKGPKVSTTLEEGYEEERRKYGMIYSGLYNSTSGLNNLNQFIQAEKITKDINPTYGSIQKLFTRNSDLLAFCEDKVLRILANKDAVFNADGNTQLTANNRVLGQTVPFSGEYGISTNPESFASESYRAYFTDKVRGTVMRLSKDGLTPISDAGMKDYFRDNLKNNTKLIGSYDDKKDEYNITLPDTERDSVTGVTVSFNEKVRGWVSFKSFVPQNAISCANEYFTVYNGGIWMHHVESQPRNTFYNTHNSSDYSSVTVLLNQSPSIVKSFNTINYEGSKSKVDIFTTDATTGLTDGQYYNLSASDGWYLDSLFTDKENGHISEFIEKEGKWFNYIKGESIQHNQDGSILINNDGSSSFDHSSFAIQGLGIFEDTNI
jgi:hypothetical protein